MGQFSSKGSVGEVSPTADLFSEDVIFKGVTDVTMEDVFDEEGGLMCVWVLVWSVGVGFCGGNHVG